MHVSNELACHNGRCYCDVSAAAFRDWLGKEYADIDALNLAWGTAFWGQRYSSFEQILPPRRTTTIPNPGQRLAFERFSSDAFVAHLEAEAAVLREVTPHLPVTTNYMVMATSTRSTTRRPPAGRHRVQRPLPVVREPARLGRARLQRRPDSRAVRWCPWILMEHSTSAVNWQPRNLAKEPGQMLRNSLQHVARGADGVLFFQWRQSRAGAEKYHSGMVPHAGRDSQLFRDVVELGATLERLAEVRGSEVEQARVALCGTPRRGGPPSSRPIPPSTCTTSTSPGACTARCSTRGVAVDVLPVGSRSTGYDVVLVPTLYLAPQDLSDRLTGVVARGGQVLVSYFSGIVDASDRVLLGGYPGAFRDLLGVRVEDVRAAGGRGERGTERRGHGGGLDRADDGAGRRGPGDLRRRSVGGRSCGHAAGHGVGRRRVVPVDPPRRPVAHRPARARARGGRRVVRRPVAGGLEVVRRTSATGSWLFAVNHTGTAVPLHVSGHDLVADRHHDAGEPVPALGVVVVREE